MINQFTTPARARVQGHVPKVLALVLDRVEEPIILVTIRGLLPRAILTDRFPFVVTPHVIFIERVITAETFQIVLLSRHIHSAPRLIFRATDQQLLRNLELAVDIDLAVYGLVMLALETIFSVELVLARLATPFRVSITERATIGHLCRRARETGVK